MAALFLKRNRITLTLILTFRLREKELSRSTVAIHSFVILSGAKRSRKTSGLCEERQSKRSLDKLGMTRKFPSP
jgi:hypothetical protein